MKNIFKLGFAFIAGVGAGYIVTKKVIESQYEVVEIEEDVEVECDDINNVDVDENKEVIETSKKETPDHSIDDYKRVISGLNYDTDEEEFEELSEDDVVEVDYIDEPPIIKDIPYNISPDDFESLSSYESDEYTLYADGYVTDSYGLPIDKETIIECFGMDFDQYFGSYADNQIWIRNDKLKMDFSIIKDIDNFEEVAPPRIKRMVGI